MLEQTLPKESGPNEPGQNNLTIWTCPVGLVALVDACQVPTITSFTGLDLTIAFSAWVPI